jgi:sarcosine oxidase subunit beta
MFEVLVVGGGVIGNAVAYHVARQGRSVLVVERGEVASEPAASWASAGGIRPQGMEPAEAGLARAALARWPSLAEELEADIGYRQGGHLLVAERADEAEGLLGFVRDQHELGFEDVAFLDRAAAHELVPGLGEQVVAGSFSVASGQADPRLTTRAFAAAAQRYGAAYWTGTECLGPKRVGDRVVGAETGRGTVRAEQVVLAAGAWSRDLAASVGISLPLRVSALQVLRSGPAAPGMLLPVLTAVGRALSLAQVADGAFLLGGGWLGDPSPDGRSYTLREESRRGNWAIACEVFPPLQRLGCEAAWGGLQAHGPDDLPFIGSFAGLDGLTLAVGSWYGFALAPAIGSAVADHLAGRPTPELAHLSPDRIAGFDPVQLRGADGLR